MHMCECMYAYMNACMQACQVSTYMWLVMDAILNDCMVGYM